MNRSSQSRDNVPESVVDPVGRPRARPYWSPYVAGVGIGLTLLASFVIRGQGIGVSGSFASTLSAIADAVAPNATLDNALLAAYLPPPEVRHLADPLLWLLLGVVAGAFVSSRLAHRNVASLTRGPRATTGMRLATALVGGVLMGFAARLARGCTSGQALTGGAFLNAGSWVFMLSVFVAGFSIAVLARSLWR